VIISLSLTNRKRVDASPFCKNVCALISYGKIGSCQAFVKNLLFDEMVINFYVKIDGRNGMAYLKQYKNLKDLIVKIENQKIKIKITYKFIFFPRKNGRLKSFCRLVAPVPIQCFVRWVPNLILSWGLLFYMYMYVSVSFTLPIRYKLR
jgi:hypothetical protein